ncbi:ribonuclease H-like domain-containing protein [Tanacetum coccineum]
MPTHPMVTRAKAGIFKPLERMNCHVTTTSPLPLSHVHALRNPNWKEAMLDEYNALITNGTWVLVPRPANVNMRSLYGLKQAPRAWFQRFASYATRVSFQHSKIDSSLFVFHRGSDIAYLLLYVDDIILTASYLAFLQRIIASLHNEFTMTDLESKLVSDGDLVGDPTLYRSLAGALRLVPSCFVIFDLEPLSLSFDFVFMSEIFKSLSFCLDRLCHLAILCLDQHAHTLHHLESLLTISLDRLDIFEGRSCISEFVRNFGDMSLCIEFDYSSWNEASPSPSLCDFPKNLLDRVPAQSVGSSNTYVLDFYMLASSHYRERLKADNTLPTDSAVLM